MAIRRDDQYENFDWQREAACRGEHAISFFPPPHFERKDLRLARERRAKAICRTCPVAAACLDAAIAGREPHGVWGGLNEIERRQLLEQRAADPAVTPDAGSPLVDRSAGPAAASPDLGSPDLGSPGTRAPGAEQRPRGSRR